VRANFKVCEVAMVKSICGKKFTLRAGWTISLSQLDTQTYRQTHSSLFNRVHWFRTTQH